MTEREFQEIMDILLLGVSAVAAVLLVLMAFGVVGNWDYQEARMRECGVQGLAYNKVKDECYGTPETN